MAGQFQGPEGLKVTSVLASEHGIIKATNGYVRGIVADQRSDPCPGRPKKMPGLLFAWKLLLIPKNLEMPDAGSLAKDFHRQYSDII